MPMRHSNLQIYLEKSLNIITELRKADPQNNYYRRFYYANLNALGNFILPEKLDCKVSSSISEFSDMLCYTCEYKSIVESLWNSKLQSNNLLVKSFLKLKSDNPLLVISLCIGVAKPPCVVHVANGNVSMNSCSCTTRFTVDSTHSGGARAVCES